MRSMRILAVAVLAVVLALSAAQSAFASTEIAYDDGTPSSGYGVGGYYAVRFTPSGQVRVVGAEVNNHSPTVTTTLYITGSDHTTVLWSQSVTLSTGWNTIAISNGPIVSGDFFIAIYDDGSWSLNVDATHDYSRSYISATLAGLVPDAAAPGDFMIRALVDPYVPTASGPVGGFLEPVNKLAVFAPYLALFGVIGAVAVIYWKRPDN